MAIYFITSEIKRDIGRKSRFFILLPATPPLTVGSASDYCHNVRCGKPSMVWLLDSEKFWRGTLKPQSDGLLYS